MASYHLVVPVEVSTKEERDCRTTPSPRESSREVAQLNTPRKSPSPQRAASGSDNRKEGRREKSHTQDTPTPQADQPTNKTDRRREWEHAKRLSLPITVRGMDRIIALGQNSGAVVVPHPL